MVQTDDGLFLAKHDPKLDPWQFRLERRASPHSIPIGAYFLSIGPDIELVKLEDADGRPAGMVFGFAIDLPRRQALKTGVHRLDITRGSDFEAFAEGVLGRLGGRFVWFAIFDDVTRIYLDCAGLVPCVFDPDLAVAATTAAAVLDDTEYEARFDTYLYDRLRVGRDVRKTGSKKGRGGGGESQQQQQSGKGGAGILHREFGDCFTRIQRKGQACS